MSELDTTDEVEPPPDARYVSDSTGTAFLHYVFGAVLVSVALALGVWGFLYPPEPLSSVRAGAPQIVVDARIASNRTRIEAALEIDRVVRGSYPRQLDALVDRGLLQERDLYYATSSETWRYSIHESGYTLTEPESAGDSTRGSRRAPREERPSPTDPPSDPEE